MANYWADLDQATRPGSAGTAADPFGVVEFVAGVAAVGPDTYSLRGKGVVTGNLICGGAHTLQAWDVATYGPWRVYMSTGFIQSASCVFSDGIVDGGGNGPAIWGATASITRCHIRTVQLDLQGNLTDSNIAFQNVGWNFTLSGAAAKAITRNVLNLNGYVIQSTAGVNTFSGNVTDASTFAGLVVNAGAVPVDAGGQQYGRDLTTWTPTWDSQVLEDFCQFPGRGVAVRGGWGQPAVIYVDVSNDHDNNGACYGTRDRPTDWRGHGGWTLWIAPIVDSHQTIRVCGRRLIENGFDGLEESVYAVAGAPNHVLREGWDLAGDCPGPCTIVYGAGLWNWTSWSGVRETHRRIVTTANDLRIAPADGIQKTFINCLFFDPVYLTAHDFICTAAGQRFDVLGCTFVSGRIALTQNAALGANNFVFRDCLFGDGQFTQVNPGSAVIEFVRCTFIGKTKAQILAGFTDAPVFTDCTFETRLAKPLPDDVDGDFTVGNLRYAQFVLPSYDAGRLSDYSHADFDVLGYNYGFDTNARRGCGAFFFGPPTATATVVPTYGPAPLEVAFHSTVTDTSIVAHHWDFGDGGTSDSSSPEHIYEEPGTYTVTYTITDTLGDTGTWTTTIYVYDHDYALGYVVTDTNFCARFALEKQPSQGTGWSLYDGAGWPMPLGLVGSCEAQDLSDEAHMYVMDCRTFLVHELGILDEWRDSVDDYGAIEQEGEILWCEEVPTTRAVAKLEHTQSHLYVKPWYKDRRNTGDYGPDGYRPGFEMDMFLRQDALPTDAAVTRSVPVGGQLTVDRNFATKYLQMGARIRVAPWRLTGAELWVREIDTGGSPAEKRMTELQMQDEWSEPTFWFSRGEPLLNRATGQTVAGTYAGQTHGPDLYTTSALVLAPGQFFPVVLPASLGEYTFNVWLRDLIPPVTVLRATDMFWRVDLTHDGIRVQDADNDVQIEIDHNDWAAWKMLTVERVGEHMAIFVNGVSANMHRMHNAHLAYSGEAILFEDGMAFFDARFMDHAVPADALQYLYRDIIENRGNATCPPV